MYYRIEPTAVLSIGSRYRYWNVYRYRYSYTYTGTWPRYSRAYTAVWLLYGWQSLSRASAKVGALPSEQVLSWRALRFPGRPAQPRQKGEERDGKGHRGSGD